METTFTAALLILFFVILTLVELVAIRALGFDVIANLNAKREQGQNWSFYFEATGVVAFILVQPVVFLWIFTRLSGVLSDQFQELTNALFIHPAG
ncbi:MAG: hypothetical protein ACF8PN_08415 [Phycisphaerales bacterium]